MRGASRIAAVACVLVGAAVGVRLAAQPAKQTDAADLLLVNGLVADGSGSQPRRADVAVTAGRIAGVGDLQRWTARERVDVAGLVVAPGFVDVHTHADRIAEKPLAENFVRMGVTTIVAGNCGSSAVDVAAALPTITGTGVSINFATLVGHNTVRQRFWRRRGVAPTADELARMKDLVAAGDGRRRRRAARPASSTCRAPTRAPTRSSRWPSAAGAAGGLYASHLRDEGATGGRRRSPRAIAVGEAAQLSGRDLPSEDRQPALLGTRAAASGTDRRGAGAWRARARRPVRLHGREHRARHPLSVLGPRRRRGGHPSRALTRRGRGRGSRVRWRDAGGDRAHATCRDRVVASYHAGSVAQRAVDCRHRRGARAAIAQRSATSSRLRARCCAPAARRWSTT